MSTVRKRAFAVAAHPDDIEFQMAGTLILLGQAGYDLHYMNLADGACGTETLDRAEIVAIRRSEAMAACKLIGASYHESIAADLGIFYEPVLLARLAAVMRQVAPEILLVQSPQDYMEDHQNACRLAVTAAFVRGMRNFATDPPTLPVSQPVTVYHCQPHGNIDPFGEPIRPGLFVDISSVIEKKTAMLACHQSQKAWLDATQGMDSYLQHMRQQACQVGSMSVQLVMAEGWRKRTHIGFCQESDNPLVRALPDERCVTVPVVP